MELTTLQKQRIEQFVPTFKRYLEATDREADLHERHERTEINLFRYLVNPKWH
jgi:hypothetical protein